MDSFEPTPITIGSLDVVVRPMEDRDVPYVYHSWVAETRCFREHPPKHTRAAISILLADPTTVRFVLCDPSDPGFIMGFIVSSDGIVHMAHVKGSFRSQGLARWMLSQVGIAQGRPFGATFRTRDLERSSRRGWEPVFIPTFSVES